MAPAAAKGTAGAPPASGKRGLAAWVRNNPAAAGAAALVGVLGVVILLKKGQANAATDAGTSGSTVDPSMYGVPGDLGGFSSSDVTGLEQQLTALQDQLTAFVQSQGKTPTPPPPPPPKKKPPKKHRR